MHHFSKEEAARPSLTARAANILCAPASVIVSALTQAKEGELTMGMMQKDFTFGGASLIRREDLLTRISAIEREGSWVLTCAGPLAVADVERRCIIWQHLVSRRSAAPGQRLNREKALQEATRTPGGSLARAGA